MSHRSCVNCIVQNNDKTWTFQFRVLSCNVNSLFPVCNSVWMHHFSISTVRIVWSGVQRFWPFWASPDTEMDANWIVKHILKDVFRFFYSFRARLVSRCANCANKTRKIGHWCQETLISYPLEKLQKIAWKSYRVENFCTQFKTKKLPISFTIMIELFSGEFFASFFQRIRNQHRILHFYTHIEYFDFSHIITFYELWNQTLTEWLKNLTFVKSL